MSRHLKRKGKDTSYFRGPTFLLVVSFLEASLEQLGSQKQTPGRGVLGGKPMCWRVPQTKVQTRVFATQHDGS